MNMPNGPQMMLKALGLDPQMLLQKAAELEALTRGIAGEIGGRVVAIDQRLTAIEASLLALHTKLDAAMSDVTPAGETGYDLVVYDQQQTKGKAHGRHNASNPRTNRSNRKAS